MFLPSRVTVPLLTAAFALASDQFDYVVVGGGTAGLTAATRLTENPNIKVAVIEAGASGEGNPNITDYRLLNLVFGTGFQWDIPTVPQASAGNRVYPQIQGKALGGSSAINGAVYLRPDVREYEAIQALGAKGWTWEKFLEYFKRSERFDTTGDVLTVQPNTSAHGTSGPIHVSYQHNISSFFKEYALPTIKAANQTITDDISDGWHPVGASPQQISIDSNLTRSYAANMYYFPNRNRENLKVFTETLVSKIIWGADNEDGSAVATGVEYITADNGTFSLNAKNIIVSAGTLNTPKVLELSGVGDSSILKDLGIDVKLDVPGVGKNLQNQFGINVQFELKSGIELVATLQSPLIDLVPLQQALSAEDQATSAEILSTANDGIPQDQFEALKNLISQGVAQTEINWSLQPGTNGSYILQFYTTNLHTFSRGTSHANSTDPKAIPTVNPRYFAARHDRFYLARAVEYARQYTKLEPLASIIESEVAPGANYTTPESIEEWLLPNFRTMSHFVGTAAALPKESNGVVDPETLIVYGTSNVRVADNSVVPLLPGIHTESIAYAIGEWVADIILKGQ